MKRLFQAAIIIALIISTIRPSAGQMTINGDVSVANNLTAQTISTTPGGTCTLGGCTVRGGLDIHQGFGLGYLYGRMWGSEIGFLQAYANIDGRPYTQLGLNPYGGPISIGTFDPIDEDGTYGYGLTVGPNAKFESDVEVDGKLSVCGGMDPPIKGSRLDS